MQDGTLELAFEWDVPDHPLPGGHPPARCVTLIFIYSPCLILPDLEKRGIPVRWTSPEVVGSVVEEAEAGTEAGGVGAAMDAELLVLVPEAMIGETTDHVVVFMTILMVRSGFDIYNDDPHIAFRGRFPGARQWQWV